MTASKKETLRKEMTARRKQAHAALGEDASDGIAVQILALFDPIPKQVPVSLYWPIGSEIDTAPLLAVLFERGHVLGLPVTPGSPGPLSFRRWTPDTEMTVGPMNIPVPKASPAMFPDILLVPLLAFDTRGYRLGYGGGYYDRTLSQARARRRVMAIGLAYDEQEVDQVPTEPTDQPLDMVITPTRVIEPAELARLGRAGR
ncbi:MAG: 5-formyltetrahydrofolate cyclo-ligase [Alphaproteobacteria bacterium]|nr:5-formyltetrahydrofolate cyclo-ligase [Alphaproteobacteria bacterium]